MFVGFSLVIAPKCHVRVASMGYLEVMYVAYLLRVVVMYCCWYSVSLILFRHFSLVRTSSRSPIAPNSINNRQREMKEANHNHFNESICQIFSQSIKQTQKFRIKFGMAEFTHLNRFFHQFNHFGNIFLAQRCTVRIIFT